MGFGDINNAFPRKHTPRRALAKPHRHRGQGGLSWQLRSFPHQTNAQSQERPFSQCRRCSTLAVPSAQQSVNSSTCSIRIVCCMDGISALTRRYLLFWVQLVPKCYLPQQDKISAPGDEDTLPFLLKQPTIQPFRDKEEEEGGLMLTVILKSVASKRRQSKSESVGNEEVKAASHCLLKIPLLLGLASTGKCYCSGHIKAFIIPCLDWLVSLGSPT